MAYWLVKSEPSAYSWDELVKDKQTCWSGVRNYAARINLRAMKKGEEVLFYHSNEGVEIVGKDFNYKAKKVIVACSWQQRQHGTTIQNWLKLEFWT